MADPTSRRDHQVTRMRQRLKKKQEALADFFDFKIYIAFIFKDRKKGSALFEAADVVPIMANNYEDKITKGVDRDIYSYESSREMIDKDIVQLYLPRYASMRKDVLGCAQDMDFFLWPRGDLLCIRCFIFSRWKETGNKKKKKKKSEEPFRLVQADFMFFSADYELQLRYLLPTAAEAKENETTDEGEKQDQIVPSIGVDEKTDETVLRNINNIGEKTPGSTLRGGKDLILANSHESMFLFVDRYFEPNSPSKSAIFKLNGICLNLPQEVLTCWGVGSVEEILRPFTT